MNENTYQEAAPGGNARLGDYLQRLRNARNRTQAQLTSLLRIQRAKLIAFERGDLLPTLVELTRLKEKLDLSDSEWIVLTQLYLDAAKMFLLPDPEGRDVQEMHFLEDLRAPNLTFAGIDLHTTLLPAHLWNADRQTNLYCDDPEQKDRADGRWITLEWTDATLRDDLLSQLIRQIKERLDQFRDGKINLSELERQALENVYIRLTREGSNPYPRPVAPPAVEVTSSGQVLRLLLGQGKYGISLVAERDLQVPAALALRSRYVLHSLAIRVAYVWELDGERWIEFHQRAAGANATWEDAWDIGAAGYIDPIQHKDPHNKTRVSPWQAGADELNKELGIPTYELPHRDHYYFLGVARDQPTGHIILLGYCQSSFVPDPARKPMALVKEYDRCRLEPEAIADFIVSKRRWVPSAILLLILVLEAYGFEKTMIEQAFTRIQEQIDLRAFPELGI